MRLVSQRKHIIAILTSPTAVHRDHLALNMRVLAVDWIEEQRIVRIKRCKIVHITLSKFFFPWSQHQIVQAEQPKNLPASFLCLLCGFILKQLIKAFTQIRTPSDTVRTPCKMTRIQPVMLFVVCETPSSSTKTRIQTNEATLTTWIMMLIQFPDLRLYGRRNSNRTKKQESMMSCDAV